MTDEKVLSRGSSVLGEESKPVAPILAAAIVLYLFYIKPQLYASMVEKALHCLISLFYIKPQPLARDGEAGRIVLYLSSTSNHNLK